MRGLAAPGTSAHALLEQGRAELLPGRVWHRRGSGAPGRPGRRRLPTQPSWVLTQRAGGCKPRLGAGAGRAEPFDGHRHPCPPALHMGWQPPPRCAPLHESCMPALLRLGRAPPPSPASHAHANPIPPQQREQLSPGRAGLAGAAPHLGARGAVSPPRICSIQAHIPTFPASLWGAGGLLPRATALVGVGQGGCAVGGLWRGCAEQEGAGVCGMAIGVQMGSAAHAPLPGCVRACVRLCVCACVRVCMCVCVCTHSASVPALLSSLKIYICNKP